ncbi:hypothetical protein Ctob_006677 [Chrysochromulina tobinii]|uniref:YABBY protein C-terminal domain-containing protein n=1 Tax=Chrysochromulina tobinii TaxID=1460289 RepID=A0A0M0JYY1_9EUKA|nr:hypothetical protein Ctob_006677 [Chrysochromulina tobinii]|eukprot:KOO31779.1 hypothetical protein Ctob_006677 [Chrysochromulina sp. CCMP291]
MELEAGDQLDTSVVLAPGTKRSSYLAAMEEAKKARGSGSASSGKRKAAAENGAPKAARAPSAFHLFMKAEVARLKAERPGLVHIEALKQAGSNWKKSLAQDGASSSAVGAQDGASAAAGGSAP